MTRRLRVLDACRGLAVSGIVLFHYFGRYSPPWLPIDTSGLGWPFAIAEAAAASGVNILLLISGFVIPMTLAACAGTGEFAVRRFARIYPPFLIWMTLTVVALLVVPPDVAPRIFQVGWRDYWANVTLGPLALGRTYVDSVYWTLTVEVEFYVLVALSHWLWGDGYRWAFLVLGSTGVVLARAGWPMPLFFSVAPLLMLGMSAYQWQVEGRQRNAAIFAAVAVLLYVLSRGNFVYPVAGVPPWVQHVVTLVGGGLMFWAVIHRPNARIGPFAWIGLISYSLYLVHNRLGMLATGELQHWGFSAWTSVAGSIGLAVILAWVSHRLIERPLQRAILTAYHKAESYTAA